MDEVGELGRVPQEEDGSVVSNKVPVALLSLELDSKATGVTGVVARARLASDGRETNSDGALGTLLEEAGNAEVVERVGADPLAVGSRALGVDDTLGDTLAIEVGEEAGRLA